MENSNSCPRFVKEYSVWQIRRCDADENYTDNIKETIRDRCRQIVKCANRGYLNPEDAVRAITEAPEWAVS